MAVGTLGSMAVVADPGGAAIGMWQPGEHRGGLVATEGAPCHFELQTRDYDGALAFYEQVFGWTLRESDDTPGFRYATFDVADGENAGIMDATGVLPDDVPAHWGVYFAVRDVDASLRTVAELGGSVVMGPDATPYGVLAVATDSTGATFKLRAEAA
jgi:predicted enzyme related to lactoylglutathione lyase